MNKSEIEKRILILKNTLGMEYKKLKSFFAKICKSEADFVVFQTHRCSMLYNIFLPILSSENIKPIHYVTPDVLSLYATKIAEKYKVSGKIPNIILVNDVCFFEADANNFLYKFSQLIIDEISKGNDLTFAKRYDLQHALNNAINIYRYAIFDDELIRNFPFKNYHFENKKTARELNELLKKLYESIEKTNIQNTNLNFSISIPKSLVLSKKQNSQYFELDWHYNIEKQKIYFFPNNKSKIISSVLLHKNNNLEDKINLTGFPLWMQFTKTDLDEYCRMIKLTLENTKSSVDFSWTTRMLNLVDDNHLIIKTKFVYFLFSLLCVRSFCKYNNINFNKKLLHNNSNLKYILMNFGISDDNMNEIEEICLNEKILDSLQSALNNLFDGKINFVFYNKTNNFQDSEIDKINEMFEDIYSQAKFYKEENDYEICHNRQVPKPNEKGIDILSFSELLTMTSFKLNYDIILASQISLMNKGLITLDFNYNKTTENIDCSFKSTELSNFVLPRRLKLFIPALSYIEINGYGIGIPHEKPIFLKQFINYVLNNVDNSENPYVSQSLKYLKEYGEEMVDRLYRCDQRFKDWNFNMFFLEDYQKEKTENEEMSYLGIMMNNNRLSNIYVDMAKYFIKYRQDNPDTIIVPNQGTTDKVLVKKITPTKSNNKN